MLVLARQRDETIVIGDDIEVTIVDIRGDKVRLGIRAPKTVSVHRKEIYDAIRRENKSAAQVNPNELPPSMQRQTMKLNKPLSPEEAAIHAKCMAAAVEEAKKGLAEGGLPIGSVLVRGDQIIGRGHNRRVQKGDPMAHAEIDCLTNAGRQDRYKDTVLYSTLAPCYLCSGAVVQFGIPKVVIGEAINFPGAPDLLRSKGVEVIDLQDPACIQMMRDFIQAHPKLWHEDIGK
jgi:cytosine/creatinine deaminase